MLFLSRKVTRAPAPCCAQPSGYFIEYAAAASRKLMNTWLSGMSPVAAEFASACKADAAELVVVLADTVADLVAVRPVSLGVLLLLEPQPATSSAAAKTKRTTRRGIAARWSLRLPERRLNACARCAKTSAFASSDRKHPMEPLWSPVVATAISCKSIGPRNRKNQMARRGSTVRVRQRAS